MYVEAMSSSALRAFGGLRIRRFERRPFPRCIPQLSTQEPSFQNVSVSPGHGSSARTPHGILSDLSHEEPQGQVIRGRASRSRPVIYAVMWITGQNRDPKPIGARGLRVSLQYRTIQSHLSHFLPRCQRLVPHKARLTPNPNPNTSIFTCSIDRWCLFGRHVV
ncbi:hypothetical protein VUR80DRAFT_6973 [Thermomyces stellatus]